VPRGPYDHIASESDSSDDEDHNTIGNVPLEWYKHEDHIGYDKSGKAIAKVSREHERTLCFANPRESRPRLPLPSCSHSALPNRRIDSPHASRLAREGTFWTI